MKLNRIIASLVFILVLISSSSEDIFAASTANPNASTTTKQLLNCLDNLASRTDKRVISGQNLSHTISGASAGYQNYIVKLANQTGKWMGMIGVDWGSGASTNDIKSANQILIDHWKNGGLITISAHFKNPWTGGDAWDISRRPYKELVNPSLNPSVYNSWRTELDKIAAGLDELQKANPSVTVLWRPFHEMTYTSCFWWDLGAYPNNPQPFKDMWMDMFIYFKSKGLNNLLWVYTAANRGPSYAGSPALAYPGNAYVDVVGIDVYSDSMTMSEGNSNYNTLSNLGKPFALTETGPGTKVDGTWDTTTLIKSIKNNYPKTAYFLEWHSWTGTKVAIVDGNNAGTLLTDSWIINRGELNCELSPTSGNLSPTPTPSSCPLASSGDFNCDGKINESDLNALLGKWMTKQNDLTGDGKVNESDLNKLLGNWRT